MFANDMTALPFGGGRQGRQGKGKHGRCAKAENGQKEHGQAQEAHEVPACQRGQGQHAEGKCPQGGRRGSSRSDGAKREREGRWRHGRLRIKASLKDHDEECPSTAAIRGPRARPRIARIVRHAVGHDDPMASVTVQRTPNTYDSRHVKRSSPVAQGRRVLGSPKMMFATQREVRPDEHLVRHYASITRTTNRQQVACRAVWDRRVHREARHAAIEL